MAMALFLDLLFCSLQFSSVTQSYLTLWDPMDCSTPGFPVHQLLLELAQTHVHWVADAIQPYPLLSPSPPAFDLSQHQGLFQGVSSSLGPPQILPRGSRLRKLCSCKYRLPFMEEEGWVRWWRSASKMRPPTLLLHYPYWIPHGKGLTCIKRT